MDLIGAHPASFIVTDHVADEIADSYPNQQARYDAALAAVQLDQQRVDDLAEVEIFSGWPSEGDSVLESGQRSLLPSIEDTPLRSTILGQSIAHLKKPKLPAMP